MTSERQIKAVSEAIRGATSFPMAVEAAIAASDARFVPMLCSAIVTARCNIGFPYTENMKKAVHALEDAYRKLPEEYRK